MIGALHRPASPLAEEADSWHIRAMPDRSRKPPRDQNALAGVLVKIASGQVHDSASIPDSGKNPAAVALGRLGGLKGGKARAEALSRKRRAEIARRAAKARWSSNDN
jgi:hypothetical protein